MKDSLAKSILVTGGTKESRFKKIEEILSLKIKDLENNPDFLQIVPVLSIGIEEIRNLQNFALLKPFQEKRKIILIRQSEKLTTEAQNALLKTLEEPPESVIMILEALSQSMLLPTIVSRCQIVQLAFESQIKMDEKNEKEFKETLIKIGGASLGQRFIMAEKMGIFKDRESALIWLDNLTFILRKSLLENRNKTSKKGFISAFSLITKTKRFLLANGNVRLGIEVFLIDFPSLDP